MAFGVSGGGGYGAGDSVIQSDSAHGVVLVPDAELLFTAQFYRHGPDLLLVGHDGRHLLITGYFSSEHHAALVAPNGARLTPDTVDLLAGSPTPGQYAQAQPTAPPDAIGKVEKAVGDVTAIRNGAAVTLHVGDAVFKSDVIQTGATSSCGISFPDGTALNLVANTRMAMNDYTFDASANSGNGALFTLVEGTFAFVAGKVAHTGDMKIATPVATMGIRGTTGVVQEVATITANAGGQTYSFAVVPDFGTGVTGVYDLYDANGNLVATVSQNGYVTFVTPQGVGQSLLVRTEAVNDAQVIFEQQILADLFRTLNPLVTPPSGNNGSSTQQPPPLLTNPIPQLLQQPSGTPINFTVPGTSGGPSTPVTATVTPAQNGPTTTVFWVGGSGNWDNALDWSDQIVPTIFSVVEILNPVTVTVSDAHTADGLVLGAGANLAIVSGGSLEVANSIQGSGTVTLDSSGGDPTLAIDGNVTLSGHGTILMTGTAADNHIVGVAGSNAFLINVDDTIQGTGTIGDGSGDLCFQNFGTVDATGLLIINTGNQVANNGLMEASGGGTLQVADALFNAGTIAATGSGAMVELSGAVTNDFIITATDGGTLQFDNITVTNSGGGEVTIDALSTFDLDNSSVIGGTIDNAGTAIVTGASVLHGDTVTNEGAITVGSGASLTLEGDTEFLNNLTGVITADGGTITVDIEVNANVNSGTIEALNGGIVNFELNVNGGSNYGLIEAGAGGTVNFYDNHGGGGGGGGGDQGGNYGTMLATGAGAVLNFGGGLDNFHQAEAADGGTFNLEQGVKNHAGTVLSTGDDSLIAISNGGDSDNAAKIIASRGGAITLSSVILENESGATVEAKHGGTITYDTGGVTNDGTFKAESCGAITFGGSIGITNDATGVFEACSDGSITFATNGTGSITNDGGQITADGGTITFDSTLTGATNTGTIEAGACGTVVIDGFVDNNALFNTGGFIEANGMNAAVALFGASIIGGTLETSSGGVIGNTSGTSTLDDVTILGCSFVQTNVDTFVDLTDTTTLSGGTVTFEGGGEFVLTGDSAQIVGAAETSDTLDNLGTITGAGLIGTTDLALDNENNDSGYGTIDANVRGQTLTINTGGNQITNAGTLEATNGGVLQIDSSVDNCGGVIAVGSGSAVDLAGSVSGGTITDGGTVNVVDSITINDDATITGGVVNIDPGLTLTLDDVTVNGSIISGGIETAAVPTHTWAHDGTSGGWGLGSNWTGGFAPTAKSDATIAGTGTETVTVSGNDAVNLLTLNDAHATLAVANFATLSVYGGFAVSAAHAIDVAPQGTLVVGGPTATLDNTTLNLGLASTLSVQQGTDLTLGPNLAVSVAGGEISVAGLVDNEATISFTGSEPLPNAALIAVNGGFTNQGTITFSGVGGSAAINGFGSFDNEGGIAVEQGAVVALLVEHYVDYPAVSPIFNNGTISVGSGGYLLIAGPSALDGNGTLVINGGGTLEIADAVANNVSFGGDGTGTLQLDVNHGADFTGTVSGLALGDVIGFVNDSISHLVVNGDTLTVTLAGGQTEALTLDGPLPAGDSLQLEVGGEELVVANGPLAPPPTSTWIDGTNGDWGSASNWSGAVVPNVESNATIGGNGTETVTVSSNEAVNLLTLNDANATLAVTNGATLAANGGVTASAVNVIDIADGTLAVGGGAATFDNTTLDLGTWHFDPQLGNISTVGTLSAEAGNTLTLGAHLTVNAFDGQIVADSLDNEGTISGVGGGGMLNIDTSASFINHGAIIFSAVGSGTTGPASIDTTGSFDNEGSIVVENGAEASIELQNTAANGSVMPDFNNGTMSVGSDGFLLIQGQSPLAGTGSIVINDGGTLDIADDVSNNVRFAADAVGTLDLDPSQGGGVLTGTLSGLSLGDAIAFGGINIDSAAVNCDVLTVVLADGQTETITLGGPLPNGTSLQIEIGGVLGDELVVANGPIAPPPVYTWVDGTTGDWGTASNWSGGIVPGAEGPPSSLRTDTAISGSGTETVTVSSSEFLYGLTLDDPNATLEVTGSGTTLYATGGFVIAEAQQVDIAGGATLGFSGGPSSIDNTTLVLGTSGSEAQLIAPADTTLTLGPHLTLDLVDALISIGGSIVNEGTILATGDDVSIFVGAAFTNDGNIVFSAANGAPSLGATGEFDNEGNITVENGDTLTLGSAASLVNNGTMSVGSGGRLIIGDFGSQWSGNGNFVINNGGTLELNAAIANTVSFAASAVGSLQLDAAQNFTGVLSGLALGDAIDFANTTITSAVVNGDILAVTGSGGFTDVITLAGPLPAGDGLRIELDGHGGDEVVVVTGTSGDSGTVAVDSCHTLTLDGGAIIAGNFIDNAGTIAADGPATLNGDTVTNTGELLVTGDGLLLLNGTNLDNCGGTVQVDAGDSVFGLLSSTINGGSVVVAGLLGTTGTSSITGAEITIADTGAIEAFGGTLTIDPEQVTNHGQIDATSGSTISFDDSCVVNDSDGNISANGTITFDCGHLVSCGQVDASSGGSITFSHSSVDNYGAITECADNGMQASEGGSITFDCSTVDTTGLIQASDCGTITFDNACVDNSGGIISDGNGIVADSGGLVTFENSQITNTGVIRASLTSGDGPATVVLDNSFVNNTGGAFSVVGCDSSIQLADSTIKGGTLAAGDGGAIEVVAAGGCDTSVLQGGCVDGNSQISIPAHELSTEWNPTGIYVTAGEEVTISATGTVSIGNNICIDGQNVSLETPGGDPNLTTAQIGGEFLAPCLIPYSLVGEVCGGTPFEVGAATTFTATSTGELFLSINDNNFTDNSGSWTASVTETQPPLTNTGLVQVEAGANLELQGAIDNDGQIDVTLGSDCLPSNLEISGTVALGGSGTGTVTLGGNYDSIIGTGDGGGTLDNVNNTISGTGQIGIGSSLTLINDTAGVIDANSNDHTLSIDTGCNTIINAGTMEATCGGTLEFASAVCNTGTLAANGGSLDVESNVTGSGAVTISGGGLVEFQGDVSAGQTVTFEGAGGKMQLDVGASFAGVIDGMTGTNDVLDIKFAGLTGSDSFGHSLQYNAGNDTTTLTVTVTDGVSGLHSESVLLQGNDTGATFTVGTDGAGGADVYDPPAAPATTGASGGLELVTTHQSLATIAADATLEITAGTTAHIDGPSGQAVNFGAPTGGLVLDSPDSFTGTISGFTGTAPDAAHSDTIDLAGVNYNSTQFSETYDASKGVLTVTDGSDTAHLDFANFNGTFDFASDGSGGTLITDPPGTNSAAGARSGLSGTGGTPADGSNNVAGTHAALSSILAAVTSDQNNASSGTSHAPAAGSLSSFGSDNFNFHRDLGSDSTHHADNQPADFGHANTPAAGPSYVPNAAEAHPEFAFDPAQHIAEVIPTAMDQFHQAVGGALLVH